MDDEEEPSEDDDDILLDVEEDWYESKDEMGFEEYRDKPNSSSVRSKHQE